MRNLQIIMELRGRGGVSGNCQGGKEITGGRGGTSPTDAFSPLAIGVILRCRACRLEHSPLERCEVVANRNMANADMANRNVANTYRYRDAEKRRAYMKDYMRKRRVGRD